MRIITFCSAVAFALCLTGRAPARAESGGGGIWTLGDENASLSVGGLPDRFYVNGLGLDWISPPEAPGAPLARLGRALLGVGTTRVSLGLIQQIYTGAQTRLDTPPPGDEPFAGYLALHAGLVVDGRQTRSLLGLAAGVVGPDAGAGLVQNAFHDIIGQAHTRGWGHQLPNEAAFDLGAARIWRLRIGRLPGSALALDALPMLAAQIGTTLDEAEAGLTLRLGQGLASDYGAPRLPPALGGGEAYVPDRPMVWYVFVAVTGRAVAHDVFLDGANFQSSAHVSKIPTVGEAAIGLAIIWHGVRVSAAEVFQTQTFDGQHGGIHQFGAFSVSALF